MKTKIIIAFVIVVLAILALFYSYQNSKDNEQVLPDDSSSISSDLDYSQNSVEDNLKLLSQDVYSKTQALIKNGLPDTNPGISLNPIKGVYKNPF
jgi:hypothetical protein